MRSQRVLASSCQLRRSCFAAMPFTLLALGSLTVGQEPLSFELAATRLQQTTVTVRVKVKPSDGPSSVSVFTGVSIAEDYIVAPIYRSTDQHVQITLSGGQQCEGITEVLDEYSGLALISVKDVKLPFLEFASEAPKVGSWVASASAWGVEKPVVSYGIVSGVDRRLAGSTLPPLLMCDLRWTETANGSAVVDPKGRLLGLVVAATNPHRRGWTYAVPAKNVKALLYSRFAYQVDEPDESATGTEKNRLVVLPRRRPIVGMELSHAEGGIVISRLAEEGPADQAGLRIGDQVVAVDGVNIRNMYQAVLQTMSRQPGDTVCFRIVRQDGPLERNVVLGGGVPFPKDLVNELSPVSSTIDRNGDDLTREIANGTLSESSHMVTTSSPKSALSAEQQTSIHLLTKAIDDYQTTIVLQRGQIDQQSQELKRALQKIRELQNEIDTRDIVDSQTPLSVKK